MNGARLPRDLSGAVLRGAALDPRPMVLARPGQVCPPPQDGPARAVEASRSEQREATGRGPTPVPGALHGYDEGYKAGIAQGEVAQQGRDRMAIEASQCAGFERGREEGRAAGISDGREAGRLQVERETRAAQEAVTARVAQLDRLLSGFPAELARRLEQVEEDMIALCHAAICRILGEELVSREGAAHCVRQAIRQGGFRVQGTSVGQLAIHVHPQELAALEADPMLAAWLRQHATTGVVRWVADEKVRMGGCMVRSADGTLDARLETQLEALKRVLVEGRVERAAEGDACAPPPAGEARS